MPFLAPRSNNSASALDEEGDISRGTRGVSPAKHGLETLSRVTINRPSPTINAMMLRVGAASQPKPHPLVGPRCFAGYRRLSPPPPPPRLSKPNPSCFAHGPPSIARGERNTVDSRVSERRHGAPAFASRHLRVRPKNERGDGATQRARLKTCPSKHRITSALSQEPGVMQPGEARSEAAQPVVCFQNPDAAGHEEPAETSAPDGPDAARAPANPLRGYLSRRSPRPCPSQSAPPGSETVPGGPLPETRPKRDRRPRADAATGGARVPRAAGSPRSAPESATGARAHLPLGSRTGTGLGGETRDDTRDARVAPTRVRLKEEGEIERAENAEETRSARDSSRRCSRRRRHHLVCPSSRTRENIGGTAGGFHEPGGGGPARGDDDERSPLEFPVVEAPGGAGPGPARVIYLLPEQTPPAVREVLGGRPGWLPWDPTKHGQDEVGLL